MKTNKQSLNSEKQIKKETKNTYSVSDTVAGKIIKDAISKVLKTALEECVNIDNLSPSDWRKKLRTELSITDFKLIKPQLKRLEFHIKNFFGTNPSVPFKIDEHTDYCYDLTANKWRIIQREKKEEITIDLNYMPDTFSPNTSLYTTAKSKSNLFDEIAAKIDSKQLTEKQKNHLNYQFQKMQSSLRLLKKKIETKCLEDVENYLFSCYAQSLVYFQELNAILDYPWFHIAGASANIEDYLPDVESRLRKPLKSYGVLNDIPVLDSTNFLEDVQNGKWSENRFLLVGGGKWHDYYLFYIQTESRQTEVIYDKGTNKKTQCVEYQLTLFKWKQMIPNHIMEVIKEREYRLADLYLDDMLEIVRVLSKNPLNLNGYEDKIDKILSKRIFKPCKQ